MVGKGLRLTHRSTLRNGYPAQPRTRIDVLRVVYPSAHTCRLGIQQKRARAHRIHLLLSQKSGPFKVRVILGID